MSDATLLDAALGAFDLFVVGTVDDTGALLLSRDARVPTEETVVFLSGDMENEMTFVEAEQALGSVTWLMEPEPYDPQAAAEIENGMEEAAMSVAGDAWDPMLAAITPMVAAAGDPSEEALRDEQEQTVEEAEKRIAQLEGMVAEMMMNAVTDEVFATSSSLAEVVVEDAKVPRFASVTGEFVELSGLMARLAAMGDPEPGTDLEDRLQAVVERLDKLEGTISEMMDSKIEDDALPEQMEEKSEEPGTLVDETKPGAKTAAYFTNARGIRVWHDPNSGKFAPSGFISPKILAKLWKGDSSARRDLMKAVQDAREVDPGLNLDGAVARVLGPRPSDRTKALHWDSGRRSIGSGWGATKPKGNLLPNASMDRKVGPSLIPNADMSRKPETNLLKSSPMVTPDFSVFDDWKPEPLPTRVPTQDKYGMFTPEGNKAVGDALRQIEADVAKYRASGKNVNKNVMRAFAVPRFKELKQRYPEVSDTEVRETTGDVLDAILGNYVDSYNIESYESYDLFDGKDPVLPGVGLTGDKWLKRNPMADEPTKGLERLLGGSGPVDQAKFDEAVAAYDPVRREGLPQIPYPDGVLSSPDQSERERQVPNGMAVLAYTQMASDALRALADDPNWSDRTTVGPSVLRGWADIGDKMAKRLVENLGSTQMGTARRNEIERDLADLQASMGSATGDVDRPAEVVVIQRLVDKLSPGSPQQLPWVNGYVDVPENLPSVDPVEAERLRGLDTLNRQLVEGLAARGMRLKSNQMAEGPSVVRPMDSQMANTAMKQIGTMNVMAISGGRSRIFSDGTLDLPVAKGYHVNIALMGDDTYRVQRVYGVGNVKGERSGVLAEQLGEVAYQASNFSDGPFSDNTPMLQSNAMRIDAADVPESTQALNFANGKQIRGQFNLFGPEALNATISNYGDKWDYRVRTEVRSPVDGTYSQRDTDMEGSGFATKREAEIAAWTAMTERAGEFPKRKPVGDEPMLKSNAMRVDGADEPDATFPISQMVTMTPEMRQSLIADTNLSDTVSVDVSDKVNAGLAAELQDRGIEPGDPETDGVVWQEMFSDAYYEQTGVRLNDDALDAAMWTYGDDDMFGGPRIPVGPDDVPMLKSNQMAADIANPDLLASDAQMRGQAPVVPNRVLDSAEVSGPRDQKAVLTTTDGKRWSYNLLGADGIEVGVSGAGYGSKDEAAAAATWAMSKSDSLVTAGRMRADVPDRPPLREDFSVQVTPNDDNTFSYSVDGPTVNAYGMSGAGLRGNNYPDADAARRAGEDRLDRYEAEGFPVNGFQPPQPTEISDAERADLAAASIASRGERGYTVSEARAYNDNYLLALIRQTESPVLRAEAKRRGLI
jgi:hypothetical protein